jgi:hypothetical protein
MGGKRAQASTIGANDSTWQTLEVLLLGLRGPREPRGRYRWQSGRKTRTLEGAPAVIKIGALRLHTSCTAMSRFDCPPMVRGSLARIPSVCY